MAAAAASPSRDPARTAQAPRTGVGQGLRLRGLATSLADPAAGGYRACSRAPGAMGESKSCGEGSAGSRGLWVEGVGARRTGPPRARTASPDAGSVLRARGSRPPAGGLCGAGDGVGRPQRAFPANEAECVSFGRAPGGEVPGSAVSRRPGRGRLRPRPGRRAALRPGVWGSGTPTLWSVQTGGAFLPNPRLPRPSPSPTTGQMDACKEVSSVTQTDGACPATPCCFVRCETHCTGKVSGRGVLFIVNLRPDDLV